MVQAIDIDAYQENGFLIVPSLFTAAEMVTLTDDVTRLCRGAYGAVKDLEDSPCDEPEADLLCRYMACHVVHKVLPLARTMLDDQRIVDVVAALIGPNVKCIHSVLFLKGPGEPGNAWHQDETFIPTRRDLIIKRKSRIGEQTKIALNSLSANHDGQEVGQWIANFFRLKLTPLFSSNN